MNISTWIAYNKSRAAGAVVIALGALALLVGWIGVAGSLYPAEQLPFLISGGLGGLALVGIGALLWLSADLRDEWTKLDLIEDALVRIAEAPSMSDLVLSQPDGIVGSTPGEVTAPTRAVALAASPVAATVPNGDAAPRSATTSGTRPSKARRPAGRART